MYKVMMSVFLAVGLLIAVTTGIANSNENTVLPEKKPFTLALKSKVNSVNDWLNSRPDVRPVPCALADPPSLNIFLLSVTLPPLAYGAGEYG